MRIPRRALALIALAILGIGSWWWLNEQRGDASAVVTQRHPDSYFLDLGVTRHDQAGNPEMRLDAEYAEHFEDEPWIHLRNFEAVSLVEGSDWQLRAEQGRLSDDGVRLDAEGNVVLRRSGEEAGMNLHTEQLSVNTETEVAETSAPVTIRRGSSSISGRGMWASLADDRVQLKSEVKARYGK